MGGGRPLVLEPNTPAKKSIVTREKGGSLFGGVGIQNSLCFAWSLTSYNIIIFASQLSSV